MAGSNQPANIPLGIGSTGFVEGLVTLQSEAAADDLLHDLSGAAENRLDAAEPPQQNSRPRLTSSGYIVDFVKLHLSTVAVRHPCNLPTSLIPVRDSRSYMKLRLDPEDEEIFQAVSLPNADGWRLADLQRCRVRIIRSCVLSW